TYTIQATLPPGVTDTVTFNLFTVPADASATITPDGGTVSLSTTTPGQNMKLTFSGTAGQRVSLLDQITAGGGSSCGPLTIWQPNGTTQVYQKGCFNIAQSWFTDVLTLPVTGTYSITVDLASNATGTVAFTLYNVPPDVSGSISIGQAATNYT